jgi:cytochrome c biogenesis factor
VWFAQQSRGAPSTLSAPFFNSNIIIPVPAVIVVLVFCSVKDSRDVFIVIIVVVVVIIIIVIIFIVTYSD